MLLAVDVGNSNIVMGVSEGDTWKGVWRLETAVGHHAGEFAGKADRLFREEEIGKGDIEGVIISSVVPRVTPLIRRVLGDMTGVEPLLLTWRTETGIELGTEAPEEIGSDLIANAVSAYDQFQQECMVIDFGTATTLMVVEQPGVLKGGVICPGLKVSAKALAGNAAQLPEIPLQAPSGVVAGNTPEAMQSGVVFGHICMVEGLIRKIQEEQGGADFKTVATGGMASLLADHTDCFDEVQPLLTLDGLRIIAGRRG